MPWVKIPKEHHPLFRDALPDGVATMNMFGGVAATVNGNMAAGLFGRSAIVKLGVQDYARALSLEGAEKFDPMGNGRVMSNTVLLPEAIMEDPRELSAWLALAVAHARTLPPKAKKAAAKKAPAKKAPAKKAPAKKAPAKKARAKKRR